MLTFVLGEEVLGEVRVPVNTGWMGEFEPVVIIQEEEEFSLPSPVRTTVATSSIATHSLTSVTQSTASASSLSTAVSGDHGYSHNPGFSKVSTFPFPFVIWFHGTYVSHLKVMVML
jgi:hypothetical protein